MGQNILWKMQKVTQLGLEECERIISILENPETTAQVRKKGYLQIFTHKTIFFFFSKKVEIFFLYLDEIPTILHELKKRVELLKTAQNSVDKVRGMGIEKTLPHGFGIPKLGG